MAEVIYADVLVILNIYVTYLMLSLTGVICRKKRNPLRLLISSAAAGFYSLIILVPDISETLTAVTRIPFGIALCLTAFGFCNKRVFLRIVLCFFAVSFSFAGIMLFLWLFFAPQGMYYSNGIVYFNINTATLVVLTIICYVIVSVFHRYIRCKAPVNMIYDCEVEFSGKKYFCHCFLDTGNGLTDPYNSNPVIIIHEDKFKGAVPEKFQSDSHSNNGKFRLIPCRSVSGNELLLGFTPDKIHIKGLERQFTCKEVTVALTKEKIRGGSFDGILPPELFTNKTDEKGADFDERNQSITFKI